MEGRRNLSCLEVTVQTEVVRSTPSHRFRTHNSVVVGSSPTRPTWGFKGIILL